MTSTGRPKSPASASSAAARNAEEAERREVVRQLRGPIAQRFVTLIPDLAGVGDPYQAIIGNVDLLDQCFKLFEAQRDAFADLLVDAQGASVADDSVRLVCGRSVNQVIGMAVRSAMRAYAERHFAGADPGGMSGGQHAGLTAAVAGSFRERSTKSKRPGAGFDAATRFYGSIRDSLDFTWQLQFFPIYVEIPSELFEKMGVGLTRLDSIDKLQRLAGIATEDIAKAEQVIGDPVLAQSMIDNNVLAAESVSQMTPESFRTVHDALAHVDERQKWDVFANKLTALVLSEDKRISKADITALADHLHLLNVHAVRTIFDLQLAREQMARFLATATAALGRDLFVAVFGPLPFFGIGDDASRRQRGYASFIETTLRGLVMAIKELSTRFKRDAPEFISECLKLVCEARRDGIATEVGKLGPAV